MGYAHMTDIERVLLNGSIAEIGALYRSRRISVAEAVSWFLARIERFKDLNAVRDISEHALDDAKRADHELSQGIDHGPLHGIPVLLKDNILARGLRASAGARALADFEPSRDATLVARLRAAGAIVLGKTNMTEFADYVSEVMPSEFSGAGGVVKNPHGIRYDRGQGSSVGSAAAVAASLAPFAIGSETQNSIQTPASYSSVVGYKPSTGLVSRTGVVPLVSSQDSPGPLTRSVADAALVTAILGGADPRDGLTLIYTQSHCLIRVVLLTSRAYASAFRGAKSPRGRTSPTSCRCSKPRWRSSQQRAPPLSIHATCPRRSNFKRCARACSAPSSRLPSTHSWKTTTRPAAWVRLQTSSPGTSNTRAPFRSGNRCCSQRKPPAVCLIRRTDPIGHAISRSASRLASAPHWLCMMPMC